MMRWVLFSVVVVALTAIATVGATYLIPDEVESHAPVPPPREESTGPPGAVEVVGGSTSFDFGIMAQATEGSHEWKVVNKGLGPVKLSNGGVTCSCTNGSIPTNKPVTLGPGESFTMTVNWNTKAWTHFHQVATVIVSNDPSTPKLEFTIEGEAKPAVVTMPGAETRIDFATVGNDKPHSQFVGVASFDRPDLKVTAVRANPELFSSEVVPMSPAECQGLKVEKGSKVVITLKPGAAIGPFTEEMVVATDHPKKPEVKFVLAGKVEGPIRITPERVQMLVPSKDGGSQDLTLWVRGKKETQFTVEKKPEGLDVKIAPLSSTGEATQYKFTVTVPPGTRSGTLLNQPIILKTDHPEAAEVKVPVSVIVRAS